MPGVLSLYDYDVNAEPSKITVDGYPDVAIFSATAPNVNIAASLEARGVLIRGVVFGVPHNDWTDVFGTWVTVAVVALDVPAYLLAPQVAPNNVAISNYSATDRTVVVEWDAVVVGGVIGYKIERSSDGGTTWTLDGTVDANATRLTAQNIAAGQSYAFRVLAITADGESGYGYGYYQAPLAAPSRLNATNYDATTHTATLVWDDNSNNETGFELSYAIDDGDFAIFAFAGENETSATTPTLIPGFSYSFRVRAWAGSVSSDWVYVTYFVSEG